MSPWLMKIANRRNLAVASFFGICSSAPAANVLFDTPVTIAGDRDVSSTSGSFVYAYHFGDSGGNGGSFPGNVVVNGITFAPFSIGNQTTATVDNVTVSASGGEGTARGYNGLGSGSAPFSSLSANYQSLLKNAVYNDFTNANQTGTPILTLTLGSLTLGHTYQFQVFVDDSRNLTDQAARTESLTGGVTTSGPLRFNTNSPTSPNGGVGQYVIGTFTADYTMSQSITFTPDSGLASPSSQIQAFELRDVSDSNAAPEPTTLLTFAAGTVSLLQSRRRPRVFS